MVVKVASNIQCCPNKTNIDVKYDSNMTNIYNNIAVTSKSIVTCTINL